MSGFILCALWAGVGVMMAAISVPLILGRVPRNQTCGFRTTKTLRSDDIWYPANRYSGKAMALASLASTAGALAMMPFASAIRLELVAYLGLAIFVIPLVVALVASLIYLAKL